MAFFSRLTPNKLDWTAPSGIDWKCPGAAGSRLFECKNGFGFEEWYRSPLFQKTINGIIYQYGYWQCFANPNSSKNPPGIYKNFFVYTRICKGCQKTNKGKNILVAKYSEIEALDQATRIQEEINFFSAFNEINKQLGVLGILPNQFAHPNRFPRINIRFRIDQEEYLFSKKLRWKINSGQGRFKKYIF